MTAAPKTPPLYISGHCGIGAHDACRGEYAGVACGCACEHKPTGVAVNERDVVPGPAVPTKDTTVNGVSFPPGVPAATPRPTPEALTGAVDDLSRTVAGWLDTAEELEALDLLATVRAARQALAQIEAVVEQRAARLMRGDVVEWPGGMAERRFGKTRKEWRHDDVVHEVVQLIAVDVATDKTSGETDDMLAALVQDACTRFAATHRPEWRVTVLKQLGIDPDDFCTAIPGRTTVAITTAGPQ